MNGKALAAWSAFRSVLIAAGPLVATFGLMTDAKWAAISGFLLVAIPAGYGIYNGFLTAGKITTGVNAGIALANADPGMTPPVAHEDVPAIIKQFGAQS